MQSIWLTHFSDVSPSLLYVRDCTASVALQLMNEELSAQKNRLKQLANTTKKLQRDGIISESPALNDRLESVRIQADMLSKKGAAQLGVIEQV